MKKGIVIIVCLVMAVLFVRCYEDPTYEAIINCYYSTNGMDKGDPVEGCTINIGRDGYAEFAIVRDGITDAAGQFKATFRYEALLTVEGRLDDTELQPIVTPGGDTIGYNEIKVMHTGKGEVRLLPNEEATLDLLLLREELPY